MKKLDNGKLYDLGVLKAAGLEVIDNNIVRHRGMKRLPDNQSTPFQEMLHHIKKRQDKLSPAEWQALINSLCTIPSINGPAKMHSDKDEDIIRAYNDNSRRYFESRLAKYLLSALPTSNPLLAELISNLTTFLVGEYKNSNYTKYVTQWQNAQKGKIPNRDNLSFYAALRPDLVTLCQENHFFPSWQKSSEKLWSNETTAEQQKKQSRHSKAVLSLYDLHYLTHSISKLETYKKHFSNGILEIYTDDNRFFSPVHRGRVNGYGFTVNNPSSNLGVLRSSDVCPPDMRKSKVFSKETRCPDRLYLEHPKVTRTNPLNMQHHFLLIHTTVASSMAYPVLYY